SWNGIEWAQEQDTGPSPRTSHALAYDSERDRIVLFGGMELSVQNVTVLVNDSVFTASGGLDLSHTSHTETRSVAQAELLGETWEYDGRLWTRVTNLGPSARAGSAFIYNGATCCLFGGKGAQASYKDTWDWDGKHWKQTQDMGPGERAFAGASFDVVR